MFDATKGQQAADTRLDNLSDQLAADAVAFLNNPGIPRAQKEAALGAAADLFADPGQLSQLAQGIYAQNSAGQPAAQLGTGSQSDPRQQMTEALNAFGASPGQARAILRILNAPGDPGHIEVEADGTPSELVAARRERDQARTERDSARADLTNERDANRNGSLAKQLADITAARDAALNSASGYDQGEARNKATAVITAINAQRGKRVSGEVEGKDEVRTKFGEFAQAVGLRRQP